MNDRMTANESCYCVQGNCIDRADTARCNGKGVTGGVSYTLNTIDRHAVCFRKVCKPGSDGKGERWEQSDQSNTLNGFEFHSNVRSPEIVCSTVDCRNLTLNRGISGTLQCKSEGGYSLNYQNPVIYDARGNGQGGGIAYADGRSSEPGHGLYLADCFQENGFGRFGKSSVAETLRTTSAGIHIANVICLERRTP